MIFNAADVSTFRAKLGGGFYQRWKSEFGATAWSLLEREVAPRLAIFRNGIRSGASAWIRTA